VIETIVENYFNYFTEIEEHYQQRRGTSLLISTLDWALIETWRNAGVPLKAVLRGIDEAFDKYDRKPTKTKKVNGGGRRYEGSGSGRGYAREEYDRTGI